MLSAAKQNFNLQLFLLESDSTIEDAIRTIEEGGREIALVCEGFHLIGIVTDSDVRRGLLRGLGLDQPVQMIMNPSYHYAWIDEDRNSVYIRMKRDYIRQMPVLNEEREVVDIYFLNEIWDKQEDSCSTPVLIMAGGLGSRLRPLTSQTPKPMLPVGGKPLLEIIIDQLKKYGFTNILLSVNYCKEMIQNYFQDGSQFDVNIRYIEENQRMGTAGSIRLAAEYLTEPFFVINGDVLTKVNYQNFMQFHKKEQAMLTLATVSHSIQIPYGVVQMNGNHVSELKEKPRIDYFINAGMYCIDPRVVDYIPHNKFFDITVLIDKLMQNHLPVASFPIHEYWMDIGQIPDYERANEDYSQHFQQDKMLAR